MKQKQKKNVLSKLTKEVKKKTNPILYPNAHNKVNSLTKTSKQVNQKTHMSKILNLI
jgi:hypothetical protein